MASSFNFSGGRQEVGCLKSEPAESSKSDHSCDFREKKKPNISTWLHSFSFCFVVITLALLESAMQMCHAREFKGNASIICEKRISILPRATLVTFGLHMYAWFLWKAVIYHRRYRNSSYQRYFSLPFFFWLYAAKPHSDVTTRKGRYFGTPLSFIWILSSSLVQGICWQA